MALGHTVEILAANPRAGVGDVHSTFPPFNGDRAFFRPRERVSDQFYENDTQGPFRGLDPGFLLERGFCEFLIGSCIQAVDSNGDDVYDFLERLEIRRVSRVNG